jgi:hypothetical protein
MHGEIAGSRKLSLHPVFIFCLSQRSRPPYGFSPSRTSAPQRPDEREEWADRYLGRPDPPNYDSTVSLHFREYDCPIIDFYPFNDSILTTHASSLG